MNRIFRKSQAIDAVEVTAQEWAVVTDAIASKEVTIHHFGCNDVAVKWNGCGHVNVYSVYNPQAAFPGDYFNFSNGVSYPVPEEPDMHHVANHSDVVYYLGNILRESFPHFERPVLNSTGPLEDGQSILQAPEVALQWAQSLAADDAAKKKVADKSSADMKILRRRMEDLCRKSPEILRECLALLVASGHMEV